MQMSDIIAALALIVSVISAGFSWWSAVEAGKARKLTQSQELAPHFINVGYIWDLVMGKGGRRDDLEAGNKSIEFLKHQLSFDAELQECLKDLPAWAEDARMPMLTVLGEGSMRIEDQPRPVEAATARTIFERKQRQYLSIG